MRALWDGALRPAGTIADIIRVLFNENVCAERVGSGAFAGILALSLCRYLGPLPAPSPRTFISFQVAYIGPAPGCALGFSVSG